MESCVTCRNKKYVEGQWMCVVTNIPIEMHGVCDAYQALEENDANIEQGHNSVRKISIFLAFVSLILLFIGISKSIDLVKFRDSDAAAAMMMLYFALANFVWLGIKHKRIRKIVFITNATLTIAFFGWGIVANEFIDLLFVIAGLFVTVFYFLAYLKYFTKVFNDLGFVD